MFETPRDVDLAIASGTALPEQIACGRCKECGESTGYCQDGGFEPFILVIDENDQDWSICGDCAMPVLRYVDVFFPPVTKSHFSARATDDDLEDLEYF